MATGGIVHIRRFASRRGERGHGALSAARDKAPVEETGGQHRARFRARRAEHDRDQPFAVLGRADNEIEAGRAGKARFHTVGAGITAEHAVVVGDDPLAETQGADVEQVRLLGKIDVERATEDRHVARRGDVTRIGQAVGIDEMGLVHAQRARRGVHLTGESLDRAGDALRDGDGEVVGRFDHQHLQRIVERDQRARAKSHLRRRLRGRAR